MKQIRSYGVYLILILGMMGGPQALASRLIILADMGNEPDEVQQMAHMIMCSNEFELEGLIAVSGIYLRPNAKDPYRRVLHPELFTEIIDAYAFIGQHQWALEHIKGNHGPVGRAWPIRQFDGGNISFLEGGGTIPWLGLVNKGLFSIDHPHWGGWSGRFSREKSRNYMSKRKRVRSDEEKVGDFSLYKEESDRWINPENGDEYNDIFTPIWRWRRAFFNNFKCRMDWCLNPYDKANHHPVAAFHGDKSDTIVRRQANPGQTISLDASASIDPDKDTLAIRWYTYPEAGTYLGKVTILDSKQTETRVTIPPDAAGKQIHVILEVRDQNPIASLYDYRRIVIDVSK